MAPPKTPNQPRGTIIGSVQAGLVTFTIRALPLPESITNFLLVNESNLKKLQRDRRGKTAEEDDDDITDGVAIEGVELVKIEDFWNKLEELLKAAGRDWTGVVDQIWAFGPKRVGPNLLVDRTEGSLRS